MRRKPLRFIRLADVGLHRRLAGYRALLREDPGMAADEKARLFVLAVNPPADAGGYVRDEAA